MPEGTEEMLADSAYTGEEREAGLREKGIEPLIVERRRRGQPELTEAQKRKNAAITPRRSRVEHVFGAIRHMKGDIVRCIGIERSRIRIGLVNLAYNMLRLCQLTSLTPAAPCAPALKKSFATRRNWVDSCRACARMQSNNLANLFLTHLHITI